MKWDQRVKQLRRDGKYHLVIQQLDEIMATSSGNHLVLGEIGLCYKRIYNYATALYYYNQSLEIESTAQILNRKGLLLAKMGCFDEAINNFNWALEIEPINKAIYNNLGIALDETGRLNEAIIAFTNAIGIDNQFKEAHNNLGVSLDKKGNWEESISQYQKALTIDNGFYPAYANMGIVFRKLGDVNKARECYDMALSIDPENEDVRHNLLQINFIAV